MSFNFTIIFLLFFSWSLAQNQDDKNISELEIKYQYTFVRDTTDLDKSHAGREMMVLIFNANTSIYYSEKAMQRRIAVENELVSAKNSNRIAEINGAKLPKPQIGYSVYRKGSKIDVTTNLYRDFFTFESGFLDWNTKFKDEKKILGYTCNKATTIFNKRLYTAWYTTEIPISEGPYRFKGLPGVILQIADSQEYDTFEALAIEKNKSEINPIQKGIPIARELYLKKREEFRNNPYPDRVMDKQKKEQMIRMFKKDNNPIER